MSEQPMRQRRQSFEDHVRESLAAARQPAPPRAEESDEADSDS